MFMRTLGRSGIQLSAMGLGCWAIGGPFWKNGQPVGWGHVNDDESIRAIHRALDLGITFFDTAGVYGCGHSERVLGKALFGHYDHVIVATKFGQVFNEDTRQIIGYDTSPQRIRQDCEDSLRRLKKDCIDLFQLHVQMWTSLRQSSCVKLLNVSSPKERSNITDGALMIRIVPAFSLRVLIARRFNTISMSLTVIQRHLRYANKIILQA